MRAMTGFRREGYRHESSSGRTMLPFVSTGTSRGRYGSACTFLTRVNSQHRYSPSDFIYSHTLMVMWL